MEEGRGSAVALYAFEEKLKGRRVCQQVTQCSTCPPGIPNNRVKERLDLKVR